MNQAGNPPGHESCQGKCHGRLKQREGWCDRPAGAGTDHVGIGRCKLHLGSTPNHVASAREQQAKAAAEQFGLSITTTGPEALRDELERAAGMVEFYRAQILKLDPDAFTWGTSQRVIKTGGQGQPGQQAGQPSMEVTQRSGINPWLKLFDNERKQLTAVAEIMERLNLGNRLVTVAEAQVAMLRKIVDAVHADPELEMRPEQLVKLPALMAKHTRALAVLPGGRAA